MGPTLSDRADEWADRLQRRINEREQFERAAAGFSATFRFEILPDDVYDGDPTAMTLVIQDGVCVAAVGYDRTADYDFALRGPYAAWRDLLQNDDDVASAVMGGDFDLEGSTMRLMQRREAIAELVRAARAVDTDFEQ